MEKDIFVSACIVVNMKHAQGKEVSDKDICWYESVIGEPFPKTKEESFKRAETLFLKAGFMLFVNKGEFSIIDMSKLKIEIKD